MSIPRLTKSNIKPGEKISLLRSCFHYFFVLLDCSCRFIWRVKCTKYFYRYWTTDADPRWLWLMVRVASSLEDPILSAASRWFYYFPIWVFRNTFMKIQIYLFVQFDWAIRWKHFGFDFESFLLTPNGLNNSISNFFATLEILFIYYFVSQKEITHNTHTQEIWLILPVEYACFKD